MAVIQQRVVRVFVSSTFRDMQAERDELVKRTFPQLRKLCEERSVIWSEVDLRWGITEEQSQRGEVLPVCLAEIQRCRPYFIGLLGERYGWIPDDLSPELIEQEQWLKEHLHHSVTELEILHGVLNNPKMNDHALFYFRDSAYINSLSDKEKSEFIELAADDEIQKYGHSEAERRADARKQKLTSLKARIKEHCEKNKMPKPRTFPNPKELGEMILRDMSEIIERLYPKDEIPEPLDRDALEHEAFAQSRAKIYIGRQSYFDRLDEHAQSEDQPLVVLGESGLGKSALLSNWALEYRKTHPEDLLIMHFIGATPYSADWAAMLRRIMGELKRRFDIQQEIPDKPDELKSAFANFLHLAATNGRVVLILDALNQLEDRDGALDLVWLPAVIPPSVRMILSTLPGRPLDNLKERGWTTLQIEPLDFDERKKLIKNYLAQFSKELNDTRTELITNAKQTANPLFLRALLDELRVFGIYEKLDERIGHYLEAQTLDKLYEKILARYEQDYERERPGLVKDAMSLIWASRRGLSEAELLDLLGKTNQPLPRALKFFYSVLKYCTAHSSSLPFSLGALKFIYSILKYCNLLEPNDEPLQQAFWSPLYLAAEPSLVSKSGLINFAHNYFREAVRDRYLSDEKQSNAHLRMADYFDKKELDARKIDEMPWQLAKATSWQRLSDLLVDREFFIKAWRSNQFEIKTYWAKIEANSHLRIVDAYASVLPAHATSIDYIWFVGLLLKDTGYLREASSLVGGFVDYSRQTGNLSRLAISLGNQAAILQMQGELDEAMRLHKEEERIFRELGNKDGLQVSLGNQAVILQMQGELDEAMLLHKEAEQICRELGNKNGLQYSLGYQALIFKARGELDEAMRLLKEKERICRELDNKDGLAESLNNQAGILKARGELDEAMLLLKEAERIFREVGDERDLQVSLGTQAVILKARGEWDEAMRLLKEKERICRELDNKDELLMSLGNQASILQIQGELVEAMRLRKEEERIFRELGNKDGLAGSLNNQAVILKASEEWDEAMLLLKEAERIFRELGDEDGLAKSLINQSLLVCDMGRPQEALPLAEEAYHLATQHGLAELARQLEPILSSLMKFDEKEPLTELGNKDALAESLNNQAVIFANRGELDEAMRVDKEAERIFRELGNKDGLQRSLGNQANILYAQKELAEAMRLRKEKERICRELGNKNGLAISLGGQATILTDRGDLDAAMRLHKEEERIFRELGNKDGLQVSLNNQGVILSARGKLDEAMLLHKEEEQICRELGNKKGLAFSLINQSQLLCDMGQPQDALPLAEESYQMAIQTGSVTLAQTIKQGLELVRSQIPNKRKGWFW